MAFTHIFLPPEERFIPSHSSHGNNLSEQAFSREGCCPDFQPFVLSALTNTLCAKWKMGYLLLFLFTSVIINHHFSGICSHFAKSLGVIPSAYLKGPSWRWWMASPQLHVVRNSLSSGRTVTSAWPLPEARVIDSSSDIDSLCLGGKWEFDMTYCVSQQDS